MPKSKKKKIIRRTQEGVVVSDKMDKTVVVVVSRGKVHPKYLKRYQTTKKFKADDSKNEYKIGDKVLIYECRPLSRDKRWRVLRKITSDS